MMDSSSSSLKISKTGRKKWNLKANQKLGEEVIQFYASTTGPVHLRRKLTYEKFEPQRQKSWIYEVIKRYEKRSSAYVEFRRGRARSESTPGNFKRMAEILERTPTLPTTELARQLNMNIITVRRMRKEFQGKGQVLSQSSGSREENLVENVSSKSNSVSVPGPASPVLEVEVDTDNGCWNDEIHKDCRHDDLGLGQTYSGGTAPVHCFICDSLDANVLVLNLPTSRKTPVPLEVERGMSVICLLKCVLEMKDEVLRDVMEGAEGKNPSEWGISVCPNPECWGAVEKAFDLWKEIKKLEVQLRKRRNYILERMRWCRNRKKFVDDEVMLRERVHEVVKRRSQVNLKEVGTTIEERVPVRVKIERELDDFNDNDFDEFPGFGDDCDNYCDNAKVEAEVKVELGDELERRRKSGRLRRKTSKFKFDDSTIPSKTDRVGTRGKVRGKKKSGVKDVKVENDVKLKVSTVKSEKKVGPVSKKIATGVIMFSCQRCPQLEKMDLDRFLAHICFHAGHPTKCTECNFYFPKDTSDFQVQEHFTERHPESQSSCSTKVVHVPVDAGGMWACSRSKCKEKFGSVEERDGHELAVHGVSRDSSPEASFICSVCTSRFYNATEVRLHKAIAHPDLALLSCSYCDSQFDIQLEKDDGGTIKLLNLDQLRQHIHEKHPEGASRNSRGAPNQSPRFLQTCPICGLVLCYTKFHHLDNHLARVHGLKLHETYECPLCHKKMPIAKAWSHTKEKHVPELKDQRRPYICQFCGKAFRHFQNRKDHEMIHKNKDTRPYQCDLCGSSFAVKTYLYIHRRVTHEHRPSPSALRKRKAKAAGGPVPVVPLPEIDSLKKTEVNVVDSVESKNIY